MSSNYSKFFTLLIFLEASLAATADVSGLWELNGPGTESEILLTAEGLRLQTEYDLLNDDPSLACIPASVSRVWANPGSRTRIEIADSVVSISYELFDLRRTIPVAGESEFPDLPSTKNLSGTYFAEMGSSIAKIQGDELVIHSRNHSPGYIRTSRGIPQGTGTVTTEEFKVIDDVLHITHTYIDDSLYEKPIVLEYFLRRAETEAFVIYGCTEADYDWFNELNNN
ncbi:MAG: hypothetical protein AB8B95_14985 [Pseudohongiellaceae bacterium]